ncbi:MAG: LytTR family transcriptional regulator, partial [Desulfobacula sp.]|nr:LytTR family transcriptional regulator [Desulfobacula sp.]
ALHLACVFAFSHVLIDIAANQLKHVGMAYGSRSVGSQWIVLYTGLALGFCIHQVTFPKLLILCGLGSTIQIPINLWIVPLLCASIYSNLFTVFISKKSQNKNQAEIHHQKKAQMELPSMDLESEQLQIVHSASIDQISRATASFKTNGRWVKLVLKTISHVSVEEHYSRVFYWTNQRLKNILVRQSLKQLHRKLGQNDFIQIHRSHLVNKKHIVEYKRKERNHWLKLELSNDALPISRRRQREVKKVLQEKF